MTRASELSKTLRRLDETHAFLFVNLSTLSAAVFKGNEETRILRKVSEAETREMCTQGWVKCVSKSEQAARFIITPEGQKRLRAELRRN